jgi:protein TonB
LHAALIALIQVAPPAAMRQGEAVIEARLVPTHTAPPTVYVPPRVPETDAPEGIPKEIPLLAPSDRAEALPVAPPVEPVPTVAASLPASPPADPQPASTTPAASPTAPAVAITSPVDLTYYSVRDLDVQPRALREILPDYPVDADRQRLSGKVHVQLRLEADGRISDIEIVSATPPGVFEDSALKALRTARFAPAQKNGRPVRARVVITVVYDWEGRQR